MEKEQDILFDDYLQKEVFPKEGMCQHGNYQETCWVCSGRKNKQKVLVAMSGGVDSSVVAAMLKKQGYDVIGVFLKFWTPPSATQTYADKKIPADLRGQNICCNQEALRSARTVANQLKIPFYVFDVAKEFKREVVDYYIDEYDSGRTPNPCVVCNKKIKFGWLLDKAKELGCEYLATGHYARLGREARNPKYEIRNKYKTQNHNAQNRCHFDSNEIRWRNRFTKGFFDSVARNDNDTIKLFKSKDSKKDQTYFLWQLDQEQLKHILFPLGNYTKPEVRKLAKKWGLQTAGEKESQNVCFVPDGDNADFLRIYVKKSIKAGNIVDKAGNILGKHEGLYKYTVGQRHGLYGIQIRNPKHENQNKFQNSKSEIRNSGFQPAYVVKLDIDKNELVVGKKEDLFSKELIAEKVNWIDSNFKSQISNLKSTSKILKFVRCQAKIRYGHSAERCKVYRFIGLKGRIKVVFNKPQCAITPGQSVVFYKNDGELVGGGIIK